MEAGLVTYSRARRLNNLHGNHMAGNLLELDNISMTVKVMYPGIALLGSMLPIFCQPLWICIHDCVQVRQDTNHDCHFVL